MDSSSLDHVIAGNLRQFRKQQGLSAAALAEMAEVSLGQLADIEATTQSADIATLWRLATALDVAFSSLISHDSPHQPAQPVLRRGATPHLASHASGFKSRALFPLDRDHTVEFYEIRIAPGFHEESPAHAPGTVEYIVAASGQVEISAGDVIHRLEDGDAIAFDADQHHSYYNPGEADAVLYLVIHYI